MANDHINPVALCGRVNTYNGRTYRDDPTIFAWDVLNEPRFTSGSTQEA